MKALSFGASPLLKILGVGGKKKPEFADVLEGARTDTGPWNERTSVAKRGPML